MDINYFNCDLDHLWLAWISVASLVALAAQFTVDSLSSSMPPKSSGPKASWNEQEVSALIHYLHQHQAEAGDNGNFKSPTYNTAADHITQYLTSRPPKTAAMVRNKWVLH
ncbi:hypothetical protein EDD16DRAFT_1524008, partial [Pisolithus croceorrhizus]